VKKPVEIKRRTAMASKSLGKKKLGYSSQMAFVISLIAGSVGTGNIWRFPRVAAQNGGAFVIAYIVMMFVVIIPVMMGEQFMGRRSRRGTPGTYKVIAGKKATWLGAIIAMIMAMTAAYYSAVLAWIVYYVGLSFTKGYYGADKVALFTSVSNGNPLTLILFVVILGVSAYICYKGVSGIEKANKIFIPVLFVCLIIMAVRALSLDGAVDGLNHYFGFELRDLLNYKVWLEALTQAVWSAGPGWGLCITLAVFSKSRSDVSLTSCVNGLGDMFAAVLSGLSVIPAIFAMSGSAEEALAVCSSGNNGLTFIAMTSLVEKMPGGYLMGILFFVSLLMAGLSSNVCHFMICSLPFVDSGKNRKKSIIGVFALLLVWGAPSAWNSTFLSNQDWVAGQMMIVGVMLSCYAMIKFGLSRIRNTYLNNSYTGLRIGKWWEISIRFLAPLIAGIMFIWWSVQCIGWEDNWWNPFGVNNLGTFIFQGALMAVIAFAMNNKLNATIKDAEVPEGELFPAVPDNGFSA
jgi:neurotransmitter:Na+ symporter, NSS family